MTTSPFLLLFLIATASAAAQQPTFPWKPGDPPPPVGGVELGASRGRLESLLGAPSDSEQIGADLWTFKFRKKGLSAVYAQRYGAIEVHLLRTDAGDIGGVRLDDTKTSVRNRWGPPSETESITAREETAYTAGKWMVVVTFDTLTARAIELWLGPIPDRD
jgi:hypothetical protein